MKKLLSVLLVAAMVLGLVGTAFAATATDVTGTTYETAVGRLNVLGILKGYEDGSFKPNNNITRAEFAAVAVRALGLDEVAKSTAGVTQFTDVPGTHWAAGYIAVAVGRGVIKGYPDNTFKPEANVTNAEAMAMLIRVLGYDPSVTGEWPMNYVSKAGEIGLTDGINLTPNTAAIRGDVALLTDNALTIGLMEQNYFGTLTSYVVTSKTLLSNKLNVTEIAGARVTNVASYDRADLEADEVELTYEDSDGNEVVDVFTFTGVDMDALLGHKVNVWAKSGEIFYAVDKTPASKIVTVTADDATDGLINYTNAAGNPATIKVVTVDPVDPVFFYNHAGEAWDPTLLHDDGGWADGRQPTVTCFLNDKGIADFVIAMMPEVDAYVTEVDTETPEIVAVNADNTDAGFPDVSDEDLVYTIVDANGQKMDIADVQVGDVVYVYADNAGGFWIVDVRNTVSGKVTKVTTTDDDDLTDYKVYVGTTAYKLSLFPATLDDEVYSEITLANVYDLVGASGKFYLDKAGKLAVADVTAPADTAIWAFAKDDQFPVGSADGVTMYIKVKTLDGTTTTLPIDPDEDASSVVAGDLLKYDLNSDGAITNLEINPAATTPAGDADAVINDDYNRITVDPDTAAPAFDGTTKTYVVTSDTKIFDVSNPASPVAITWAAVENGANVSASVWANDEFPGRADLILVHSGVGTTTTADYVALKYKYRDSDGDHLVVDENGTEKDYTVATGATDVAGFEYKEVATLDFNASGDVTDVDEVIFNVPATKIAAGDLDSTGGIVILAGTEYYMNDETVVIDCDGSPVASTWSAIKVGYTIKLYATGSDINVVVITDK